MTEQEADAVQALVSAAIRVARTPMTGVPIDSPMARSVFGLTLQLAAAGFIRTDEAVAKSEHVSQEGFDAELPERAAS